MLAYLLLAMAALALVIVFSAGMSNALKNGPNWAVAFAIVFFAVICAMGLIYQ